MLFSEEELKKIKDILEKSGIKLPPIAEETLERDLSITDITDKKNIQLLESVLEQKLRNKNIDVVRELEKYGFKIMTPEDFEILKKHGVDVLEPDWYHTLRYLCKGWDWSEIEPGILHGSMCIWKKDGRYYYCEGFIDEKKKEYGVLCRRIL